MVRDLFHPLDDFAAKLFLDCDVGHGCIWRSAVPVLHPWWNPDHVALSNLLNRASPLLNPARALGHDQGLTERMRMPCTPRAGCERLWDATVFTKNRDRLLEAEVAKDFLTLV